MSNSVHNSVNGLTGQYLSLLIAIQEMPFGTLEKLAKKARVSKPTAAKRLRELQGLRGGKSYFSVTPLLNYRSLGLEAVDVLLSTPDLKSMETLENVATNHPYTGYRCRCYGSSNGLFLQFRTPQGTTRLIRELIEHLSDKGLATDAKFLATGNERTIHTSLRIKGWDPNAMTWKFDWDKWFQKVPEPSEGTGGLSSEPGSALRWLTKNDIHVIRELMNGARRKNSDVIKALSKRGVHITPQTFSRRLKTIEDECIEGYRVTFDPVAFDIYSNVIVFGSGNAQHLDALRLKMEQDPIPFESTLRTTGENLFWFIRLQPTHLSPLFTNLFSNLSEMSVCIMDYSHTFIYFLWPDTFNGDIGRWRTDPAFMVDDVLKASGVK